MAAARFQRAAAFFDICTVLCQADILKSYLLKSLLGYKTCNWTSLMI